MIRIPYWALAAALLPLAACNTNQSSPMASTVPQPMPAAVTANAQDQAFLQAAASSDQFEIQSSRLALERARRADVRAYAQHMIDDHSGSTSKLTGLAAAKGAAMPQVLDPAQQQLLASLSGPSRNFDAAYLRAQITAHEKTVAAFRTELSGGQDPDVKMAAQAMLPTIEQHLQDARRLAGRR